MTDWAQEVVDGLTLEGYWKEDFDNVVKALRKAKADGMRLAAQRLRDCGECDASDHAPEMDEEANKIEKGEL